MDAGTANCGYSVIAISKKNNLRLLDIGQITSTFRNLTEETVYKKPTKAQRTAAAKRGEKLTKDKLPSFPPFAQSFPSFYNAIDGIFKEYPLNSVIAERFQTRGHGGPLIEMVGIQLGTLKTISHQRNVTARLVIASQWKNRINKLSNLEDIYDYAKQFGLTPHECDSMGMTLFHAEVLGILPLETSLIQWRSAISAYFGD